MHGCSEHRIEIRCCNHHQPNARQRKTAIKNKQNIESRHRAFYEAGTACFWVLYGCVLMTAPAFARQLRDTCDRSTYTNPKPNQMDGGRAWRMIIARQCPPSH